MKNKRLYQKIKFILNEFSIDDWINNDNALRNMSMWLPLNCEDRVHLLKELGVRVGEKVIIDYGVWIDPVAPDYIEIEDYVTIAFGCSILTHHSGLNTLCNIKPKRRKTIIKQGARIGVRSTLLPGVIIGKNSIVGAGSLVSKDIPDNVVAFGNPAVVKYELKDYIQKYNNEIINHPSWFGGPGTSDEYKIPIDLLPDYCQEFIRKSQYDSRKEEC